ncbi:MAG: PEP-CTERM sorting domain-containing protein [Verrucomicrobiales bacterium]
MNHEVNLGAYFFNTSAAGDGTLGEIYINGIQVFSGLSDGPNTSANYYGQHLLQIGDVVDFVVTPNNPADDGNDGTNWRSFISLTPEPSRAMLLVLGLGAMLARRRR